MDLLRQDARYAVRTLVRAPGFAVTAILTIAVGVGASAAIFSIVNAMLLRPLAYPRADDLILVAQSNRQTRQSYGNASPANFLDWRVRNRSFTGLAASRQTSFTFASGDRPERVTGAMITANFFDVLEVRPAVGRTFLPADEGPGAPRVAVLSDTLWRLRFGGRPDVVGQTTRLNDEPYTIVGVMPRGIDYPEKAQLWVPPHWRVPDDPLAAAGQDPAAQRDHSYFSVLGRLRAGVSVEAANADMDVVATGLERDYPNENQDVGVSLVRLRDDLVADVRSMVLLLFAAVGLLLLIATANVSGLLVARATARHQEIAVRVALGATPRRILLQLLTESVLLATLGGSGGVLLALWLIGPLAALSPSDLAVAGDITIDRTVLLFGLAVSTLTGLLFGLAPARQLSRVDVLDDLKQSARGASGARQRRTRATLVVAEIALSLVLLVAAGLTIRSFIRLQRVSPGFEAERVVTLTVSIPSTRYSSPQQKATFWNRALDALRAVTGVDMVAATSRLPLLPGNSTRGLTIASLPPNTPASADYRTATPDYFRVMGIPLLRGRAFDDADGEHRPLVALVSSSGAERFWPGRDPIGQHFLINDPGPQYTVVGVVGDVRSVSLAAPPRPTIYVPSRQDAWPFMTFVFRTAATPALLAPGIRRAIWSVDKDQPVGAILTMDEQLSNSLSRRRFGVTLLTAFGATAASLAAIGLYGVLAFIVAQRRREIGVRIALGARPRDVIADVLGHGLRLTGVGIGSGIVLALAATRLLTSLLFGTSPTDVPTFAAVAMLLVSIAFAASVAPAIRASRVDPLKALRDE
jgi:putative ABC transport system permease protein